MEDESGNQADSCWGFYGRDFCEIEAKAALEYIEKNISQQKEIQYG